MANVKITELTADTNPASTDVLPIVDISADETKKVTIADLLENAGDGSAGAAAFGFDADPDTGMYRTGTNALALTTGGTGRLFIDSSGNAGIGTSSPADTLHVAGSGLNPRVKVESTGSSSYPGVRVQNPAKIYDIQIDGANGGLRVYDSTAGSERVRIDDSGNARFTQSIRSTASNGSTVIGEFGRSSLIVSGGSQDDLGIKASGNMRFAAGGNTERMRITGDGKIGVGTSNPGGTYNAALDITQNTSGGVFGSANTASAKIQCSVFSEATTGALYIAHDGGGNGIITTTRTGTIASLQFGTANTERMRIDGNGNVGIGVTPTTNLHVKANQARILIDTANSSGTNGLIFGDNGTTVGGVLYSNTDDALYFNTNGANERVRIDSSGNVGIGTSGGATGIGNVLRQKPTGGAAGYFAEGANSDTWLGLYSGTGTSDSSALFFPSTGSFRIGTTTAIGTTGFSEKLRITSGGNIAIGASSPQAKLHVVGDTGSPSVRIGGGDRGLAINTYQVGTVANAGVEFEGVHSLTSELAFKTVGTRRATFSSAGTLNIGGADPATTPNISLFATGNANFAGNVSIGATAAQAKLDVRTGATGFAQFAHSSGNGGVRVAGSGPSSNANLVFSNNQSVATSDEYTIQLSGDNDSLVFRSGGPADTERVRFTSDGKVGIGTSSPDELLHVTGAASELKYTNTTSIDGTATTEQIFKLDTEGQKNNVYGPTGSIILRQDANPFSSVEANYKPTRWEFCTQDSSSTDQSEVARLTIDSNGSLSIFNGTAPTASATNGVKLYAEDVSSSSELKVRDEAGNVTTLSPHNFDLIPEGPSEDMAWSYYSERDGKRINVDMLKAVRLLEQLSGEQLVFTS